MAGPKIATVLQSREPVFVDRLRRSFAASFAAAVRQFGDAIKARFGLLSSITNRPPGPIARSVHPAQFPRLASLRHELAILGNGGRSSVAVEPFETAASNWNRTYLASKARVEGRRATIPERGQHGRR